MAAQKQVTPVQIVIAIIVVVVILVGAWYFTMGRPKAPPGPAGQPGLHNIPPPPGAGIPGIDDVPPAPAPPAGRG